MNGKIRKGETVVGFIELEILTVETGNNLQCYAGEIL
jgi:hypothetical protein